MGRKRIAGIFAASMTVGLDNHLKFGQPVTAVQDIKILVYKGFLAVGRYGIITAEQGPHVFSDHGHVLPMVSTIYRSIGLSNLMDVMSLVSLRQNLTLGRCKSDIRVVVLGHRDAKSAMTRIIAPTRAN